MKSILIISSLLLFSCRSDNQQSDKIISASKKYYLTTTVNSSDKSKEYYTDIVIHLYNASGQLKSSLNTHAGDFSKWAVGWDTQKDTVILFSSDIGTHAWKIELDNLKPIELSDNIKQIAKDIKTKKYSDNRWAINNLWCWQTVFGFKSPPTQTPETSNCLKTHLHYTEGRPAYHPKDLLKLYVYGYLNSIRSSRALEKECKRNIPAWMTQSGREVMWLLKELVPDHNTISNFRRDNEKAIRKVFRHTVSIAKHFNLIGGKLIAGDSTKLRAQNSKKNNFTPKKIEKHLEYIEAKLNDYNSALSTADEDNKAIIKEEIQKHTERKAGYQNMQQQLEQTGEVQISTSDPESRQMITRNNITEVAYNVQTTVDAKNYLPIDYKVTNENDSKAMGGMLCRAKVILESNDFAALYDKSYHTGSEIKTGQDLGINLMVAIPEVASHAPDENYDVAKFIPPAESPKGLRKHKE